MIDVYGFLVLCTDNSTPVTIYDMNVGDNIFTGSIIDAMFEYGSYEVLSFDSPSDTNGVLTLNIDTAD